MKKIDLTFEEKIGQMLMIGIGKKEDIPKVLELITNHHIGGVLLYKNNYDNYEEMVKLIKDLNKANKTNKIPLFIAVDQEGGIVNRMPNEFENIYGTKKLASLLDENLIKQSAEVTGKMLKETGINLNLAPVLDRQNKQNKWLSSRCFSKDPKIISKYSDIYIKKLSKNNVIPVVKHFPGHGSTKLDSHVLPPTIKLKNISDDLYPFQKTIENGCEVIMSAHIFIKDIDRLHPCSLSKKIIKKTLRKKLNYNGIIMTDEIRMKGIRILYGKNRAIKKAINAGNDIILLKYKENDHLLINKIKNKIKNEKQLDEHVERILNLKSKYKLSNEEKIKGCNIKEINNKIKQINAKVDQQKGI